MLRTKYLDKTVIFENGQDTVSTLYKSHDPMKRCYHYHNLCKAFEVDCMPLTVRLIERLPINALTVLIIQPCKPLKLHVQKTVVAIRPSLTAKSGTLPASA